MSRQKTVICCFAAICWMAYAAPVLAGSITDFFNWTQVQDPPQPGMTGSVTALQVTLTATGKVPAATDIGYQSVNGGDVAGSTAGNYFSPSQDFHIAVDFNVSALSSVGFAAIGFGIGEDAAGMNSAGPLLTIVDGVPFAFAGGASTNDTPQPGLLQPPGLLPANSGRFFVEYHSASGDIVYGVNTTPGSSAPSHTGTFSALQRNWNGDDLLASFFLRSDELIVPMLFNYPALSSGEISAVFSNFTVAGTPVSIVPLPAAVWLFGAALGGLLGFRGRRRAAE